MDELRSMALEIADRYGISKKQFDNLIWSESKFKPDAYNKNTQDRGIAQISRIWHPEVSDECAFDPKCAMEWAAQRIKDGYVHEWVVCNCYAFVQAKIGALPLAKDIKPNSTPIVGSVAILNFNGVIHYQLVTGLDETGYSYIGANREPCLIKDGHDEWGDSRLVGFFDPHKVDKVVGK